MNKQTKREMINSKKAGQKRSQTGNKEFVIYKDLYQRKKSRSSHEGSSGLNNYISGKSTQGTSKKHVTVQQFAKTKISLKLSDEKQVSRPPSTTGKRKLSKYDIVSPKNTQSREHNIPRSTTSSRKGESLSLIKRFENIYRKQQSKLQPSETDAKNVQLKNNAAQTWYRPEQSVVSKLSHGQFSFLPSSQQTDDRKVSPTNNSRNDDRNRLKLQPAVTKPDTFHTKPLDKQGTYTLKKENVNDQRRSSTASEKSSGQSSAFCSVRLGDNSCISPDNNSRTDCSKEIQLYKQTHKSFSFLSSERQVDNRYVSPETNPRHVDIKPLQLQSAVSKQGTFHMKSTDTQVNYQRRSSTASEKSSELSSSYLSVRLADYICASQENNSNDDCSKQVSIAKKQSFGSSSSTLSVASHISTDNNSETDNDNDQLLFRPRFTGTHTFLTQPKGTDDECLQGDVAHKQILSNSFQDSLEPNSFFNQMETTNEQQISCSVPELSFGRDSSSCSFQQADYAGVGHSLEHYSLTWRPPGRNSCQEETKLGTHRNEMCQEINENRSVNYLSGEHSKHRDSATIVQLDMAPEIKEVKELQHDLPYLNFIGDVSIKTEQDSQPCQITGFCQLENGAIVLTEFNNKAIKTLNCQNYRVIDTMPLSNYPLDICTMEESEACVILYESSSQCKCTCISVHDSIEMKQQVVLEHDCICVAYCNEKMFVGNSKCRGVYIYDKNWSKINKISNDLVGTEGIFSNQFSISVSFHDNETTIYIADEDNGMHSIIDTGKDIEKRWKFKDHESFKATGMCSDSKGDILLVDRESQRLIKMNTAGMILAILLDNSNGNESSINIPLRNKKNNNLILSLYGKDFIRVFDFK